MFKAILKYSSNVFHRMEIFQRFSKRVRLLSTITISEKKLKLRSSLDQAKKEQRKKWKLLRKQRKLARKKTLNVRLFFIPSACRKDKKSIQRQQNLNESLHSITFTFIWILLSTADAVCKKKFNQPIRIKRRWQSILLLLVWTVPKNYVTRILFVGPTSQNMMWCMVLYTVNSLLNWFI